MFGLKPTTTTRAYLRAGSTDLRLSFEGLYALVNRVIQQDPKSGHLFVFCNRARNRVKVLYWDGSGLWVCAKRLESGTFDWPKHNGSVAEMNCTQLQLLLEGFELRSRRGWYRRNTKTPESIFACSMQ